MLSSFIEQGVKNRFVPQLTGGLSIPSTGSALCLSSYLSTCRTLMFIRKPNLQPVSARSFAPCVLRLSQYTNSYPPYALELQGCGTTCGGACAAKGCHLRPGHHRERGLWDERHDGRRRCEGYEEGRETEAAEGRWPHLQQRGGLLGHLLAQNPRLKPCCSTLCPVHVQQQLHSSASRANGTSLARLFSVWKSSFLVLIPPHIS